MRGRDILILVGFVLAMLLGGVAIGYSLGSDERTEIETQLAAANARAANFEQQYLDEAEAYRALAVQVTEDAELKRQLRRQNAALAAEIEDAKGTILSLQRTNAELSARLEGQTGEVQEPSEGTLAFDLFSREAWGERSFLEVSGPVVATPDSASWDLSLTGAFALTTVVDRRGEADLAVSVFFEEGAPFSVSSVDVTNNVFDPLTAPPDRGFLGDAWELLKGELFDLTAWRHRAEGAFVGCLITSCWP